MATINKQQLSKEYLLEQSNSGFDFYEFVLGDLEMAEQNRCKNITSPFYDDSKPSLSIFESDEMWCFFDHGEPSYKGDVFSFASFHYGLDVKTEFGKILRAMYNDLKIEIPLTEIEIDDRIFDIGYQLQGPSNDPEGRGRAYDYFKQFGISPDTLVRFDVRAIDSYYVIDKNEEIKQWYCNKELVIAYEDVRHTKLYKPGATEYRFQYLGSKPKDFVFGQAQLLSDMVRTKKWKRELLIIAAGEKDVMTLTSLGYDAICLNSETVLTIPEQLESSILNNYKNIMVLYDRDQTGIKSARALQKKYAFKFCRLPNELVEKGGKDVSDYVKLGFDTDRLHQLIKSESDKGSLVNIPGCKLKMVEEGYRNGKGEFINQPNEPIEEEKEDFLQSDIEMINIENEVNAEDNIATDELDENTIKNIQEPEIQTSLNSQTSDLSTPLLSGDIFNKLPDPLRSICNQFSDPRERDVVFLSNLVLASTLFPSVKSVNSKKVIGSNLFLFITAPAASGKGVADWGRHSGKAIQKHFRELYAAEFIQYRSELSVYKKAVSKNPELKEPKRPVRKSLFIPANTSVSKMIEMLGANENFGIIFETEGDTLAGALKTEWGDFSDIIRRCFHHESLSFARRSEDEFIEVDNPHLSIMLTGTPKQVSNLIDSVENGFFSRLMFYDFESPSVWKSQLANSNTPPLDDFFSKIADQYFQIWTNHQYATNTFINFTDDQIIKIDNYFSSKQRKLKDIYGEDIVASIHRGGVMCQRIAMILSAMRTLQTDRLLPSGINVADLDFNISLSIIDTLLTHLEITFTRMKGAAPGSKLNVQQRKVWQALPTEFTRKEYDTLLINMGIEYKTGEKYLGDLKKKDLLLSVKHGVYRKAA